MSHCRICRSAWRILLSEDGDVLSDEVEVIPDELDPDESDDQLIEIPCSELSEDALRGVVESFVLREGTDYGLREFSLEEKVQHVMEQLRRGQGRIVFQPATESVDIVSVERGRRR